MESLHANQKPLKLMERIIESSTDVADVVWEPFGGLCSATVAAFRTGRSCYAAEILPEYFDVATVILGIGLKGRYVLAKEKEPSFRYKVTPSACMPAGLVVVVPWALANVISRFPPLIGDNRLKVAASPCIAWGTGGLKMESDGIEPVRGRGNILKSIEVENGSTDGASMRTASG